LWNILKGRTSMKFNDHAANLHHTYMDFVRHWHADSERYAGGDALFTAFDTGWEADTIVAVEEHQHTGGRSTCIFYFTLTLDGDQMIMPVTCNPYVERLLDTMQFKLEPLRYGEAKVTAD
jgi:hypothetical protein